MLDNLRKSLAIALVPELKQKSSPVNLSFLNTPGQAIYPELTVRKATREGYKLSLYVYRAIRTIVQAGSGIPWIVEDKKGEVIEGHPISELLKHPNPEMSGQDVMEFMISHLKLVGNALWQPLMVGRDIRELWVVMPDLVQPIPGTGGDWLRGYQVTEPDGHQRIVERETFIHFMQFDPGNPYWGIGDLQAAARTVDTDNEAQDTQKVSMQNRGVPSGVFQHTAELTAEQFEEQNRRVQEIFLEKTRRRAPWVLGAGATWQQMSLTPIEMDFVASRLSNKRDIAAAFGISPIFLGDLEQSSYNNMAEARKALYQDCVIPLLDDIRSTLNLKIAPFYGGDIYITYDLSNVAALRIDFGLKVEQASKLFGMGVPFSQINGQLELGFEEFDGWDTGYLPFSLAPVGSPALSGEAEPVKMLSKAMNLASEEQKTAHWKRVDRRRIAWWGLLQKKVQPLYADMGAKVAGSMSGKSLKLEVSVVTSRAKETIDKLSPAWEKLLTASGYALVEDFGQDTAEAIGGFTFDPGKQAIRTWLKKHAAENVKTILDTQKEAMGKLIAKGVEDNLTTPQIARSIRSFYSDNASSFSMRVARTEVATASGYGNHEAANQSGVAKRKFWISARDDRTRDEHFAMDSDSHYQAVSLNEAYPNGMMYPGDPSGGPENVVNCRCAEGYGS